MARPKFPDDIYIEIIQKSIDFIEECLSDTDIKIQQDLIGGKTGNSSHNLRIIFKRYRKEKLSEVLERLKLDKAKRLLIYTKDSVTKIAADAGFGDSNSLRKAFKRDMNYPIILYRSRIEEQLENFHPWDEPFRKEMILPFEVISVRAQGDYYGESVEMAWEKLLTFVNEQKLDLDDAEYFGFLHDDPFATRNSIYHRYDACIAVKGEFPDKKKFRCIKFPKGYYLIFRYTGSYHDMESYYMSIFNGWKEEHTCDIGGRPIIERYLTDPQSEHNNRLVTEILIPIISDDE